MCLVFWSEFELTHHNRAGSIRILSDALRFNPRLLKAIYPLLKRFTLEEVRGMLPQSTAVWLHYGQLAHAEGKESAYFFTRSLEFLDQEQKISPHYFIQVYTFYRQQKEEEKAAQILRLGIEWLPEYAPFHIHLGDYYRRGKKVQQAENAYQQALHLDPRNDAIRKRISQLVKQK
ncbi:MAG: hypothetical protein D3923_05730 [Candidatus Electrothrix sp. AR3]|nr:hypothetical protein [Candidatus Electrothrix sp. AR3]